MQITTAPKLPNHKITSRITWVVMALVVTCMLVATGTPNLLRSRTATGPANRSVMRSAAWLQTDVAGAGTMGRSASATPEAATDFRKVIQTGNMELVFPNPADGLEKIARLCSSLGGYVESSTLLGSGEQASAELTLRVPAGRFEEAREQIRRLAKKVEKESVKTSDVTGQYVDRQASLRNFRAEEEQYLQILRQSGTIKDTLAVAERLAEVRGELERTQGELAALSHQVEMSTLSISLRAEPIPTEPSILWRPAEVIRGALHDSGQDLADYANFMLVALVRLPAAMLWVITIGTTGWLCWRVLRWGWRRLVPPTAAVSA